MPRKTQYWGGHWSQHGVISYWDHKNSGADLCDHIHQTRLVISFSFITLDFGRSRDHPSKELGPVSEYPHYVTAAILVFQTNPPLLYFRCIFLLKMLCLLDVLCLLEMLCLLDMLCLLEVFCLLEMLYLLEMLCLLENALLAWGALLTWDALLTWEALLTWDLKGSQR